MDNLIENNVEVNNIPVDEEALDVQSEVIESNEDFGVDNTVSNETINSNEEKPVSVRRERLYGITKGITSFLLQILSIFINSCAGVLAFFSCGVAGYGIAAALVPELQQLPELLNSGIYNVLFFGIVICTIVLLIVAIVPASLGLVASIASIKAFFRKLKQHRPKPFITFFLGIISFLVGVVNIATTFIVVVMIFGAFATFSVPSFFL